MGAAAGLRQAEFPDPGEPVRLDPDHQRADGGALPGAGDPGHQALRHPAGAGARRRFLHPGGGQHRRRRMFAYFWISMVVMTVGELILVPTASTYAANLAPVDKRGRYMSIFGLSWKAGPRHRAHFGRPAER